MFWLIFVAIIAIAVPVGYGLSCLAMRPVSRALNGKKTLVESEGEKNAKTKKK
jgi:hypothetical protein